MGNPFEEITAKLDALAVDVRALKGRTNEKPADEIGGLDMAVKITGLAPVPFTSGPTERSPTAALVVASTSSEVSCWNGSRTVAARWLPRSPRNEWLETNEGQRANANPSKTNCDNGKYNITSTTGHRQHLHGGGN